MNKFQFFWDAMELCDWSHEGDDGKVPMPDTRLAVTGGVVFRPSVSRI
mgnify:CR=1 FL=1